MLSVRWGRRKGASERRNMVGRWEMGVDGFRKSITTSRRSDHNTESWTSILEDGCRLWVSQ